MNVYVAKNQQKHGPYSLEEVQAKLAAGEFAWSDLGWHQGVTDWRPLSQLLPAAPPPFVPGAPAMAQQPSSGLARTSFIIAIVGIGGWFLLMGIAAVAVKSGATETSPQMITVGLCMFAGLAVNLLGVIFGLITIGKPIPNKWMAVTGTILNALELLGILLLMAIGLASK